MSHRLPIERQRGVWATSPGGLVAALKPALADKAVTWVGWLGAADEGRAPPKAPASVDGVRIAAVGMSRAEITDHYHGMCNATLWPLFHDRVRLPVFHRHWWRAYVAVNERFAASAAGQPHGGAVWVHDYQLTLVPAMLRRVRPELRIGFFLHIPFPPPQLLAQLPWRRDLLTGLLGADAIAFQTPDDAANFRAAAQRYAGAVGTGEGLVFAGRRVRVDAIPVGIDDQAFAELARSPQVAEGEKRIRAELNGRRIFLGVDRLDYTKGIRDRLRAYETLLERDPGLAESAVFLQVAVPSRERALGYAETRNEIERMVGHLNGRFARFGRVPVQYQFGSLDRAELVAHYRAADVMVVTPPRDGMNLVALEFVASRVFNRGVLILSEFAGAARLLRHGVQVNPYDIDGIADAYEAALAMPPEEQRRRMRLMRARVRRGNVFSWSRNALAALDGPGGGRAEVPPA